MNGVFSEHTICLLLEKAYTIVSTGKKREQFFELNAIQRSLMDAARECKNECECACHLPFPVELRRWKIADLFVAFCENGDPVTKSLVHAFSLLINP